jgi:hypothetical protein
VSGGRSRRACSRRRPGRRLIHVTARGWCRWRALGQGCHRSGFMIFGTDACRSCCRSGCRLDGDGDRRAQHDGGDHDDLRSRVTGQLAGGAGPAGRPAGGRPVIGRCCQLVLSRPALTDRPWEFVPLRCGAPEGIRTPNLLIRRDVAVIHRPRPRAAGLRRPGPKRAQLGGLLGSAWGQLLAVRAPYTRLSGIGGCGARLV